MSATIHSFDLLMALYHQKMRLFDDIQKLKQIAKQERWLAVPDFHNLIVFKEQAIIVKRTDEEIVFTSSNMDRHFMQLTEKHEIKGSRNNIHIMEIYTKNIDLLETGLQL